MTDSSIFPRQTVHASAGGGRRGAHGAADPLGLAGAPTFALMALLTVASGSGEPDWLCSAAHVSSPLNGMATMYLLMSVFNVGPWLKVISGRRSDAGRP